MRDPQLTDLSDSTDIAIVGMAGRFPGARSVDEFWHNLKHGVESITRFSDDELIAAGVDPALLSDPSYVKAGAVLADADTFDAEFFGLTPLEARIMDPQQRLFVETVWSAIENAGHNVDTFNGTIGLFAGAGISTYLLNNLLPNASLIELAGSLQVGLGNDKDSLATRAAYLLNLTGPCYTVQTYCSTSLVAVSIASSSLLNGECDMALAGGVLVQVPQATGYLYQEGGIASPDGRCRAFDAEAKGAPLGNGVAVVALRRLADAIADGNEIYAVIKGSAVNNDGSLKVGYTAPGVRGQTNVIIEALANADVDPATVSYIETHGTGTALGDAAEFAALVRAFRSSSTANGFCAIGSVKTNVGHLDRAAGVTGLIKTALALKNELIPPSLNFQTPNPQLNIADSPFVVNTALSPWRRNGHPRRAGVSAFGIGGTNAHVVLEEAPDRPIEPALEDDQLLIVSARSEAALETATENLATYLADHPDAALADVAFTLQLGRRPFASSPCPRRPRCHRRRCRPRRPRPSPPLLRSCPRRRARGRVVVPRCWRPLCRHGPRALSAPARVPHPPRPLLCPARAVPRRRCAGSAAGRARPRRRRLRRPARPWRCRAGPAHPDASGAAGGVCRRVCPGPAAAELGPAPARADRLQPGRVHRGDHRGCVDAGGRGAAGGDAGAADRRAAGRQHAGAGVRRGDGAGIGGGNGAGHRGDDGTAADGGGGDDGCGGGAGGAAGCGRA